MVEARYHTGKEKAKAEVQQATAMSLTSDMWTFMNMDAYLTVTCHFIDGNTFFKSILLGMVKFVQAHCRKVGLCQKEMGNYF